MAVAATTNPSFPPSLLPSFPPSLLHFPSRRPILANGTAQWTIYDGAAPARSLARLSPRRTRLEHNAIPFVGGYFRTQCVRAWLAGWVRAVIPLLPPRAEQERREREHRRRARWILSALREQKAFLARAPSSLSLSLSPSPSLYSSFHSFAHRPFVSSQMDAPGGVFIYVVRILLTLSLPPSLFSQCSPRRMKTAAKWRSKIPQRPATTTTTTTKSNVLKTSLRSGSPPQQQRHGAGARIGRFRRRRRDVIGGRIGLASLNRRRQSERRFGGRREGRWWGLGKACAAPAWRLHATCLLPA